MVSTEQRASTERGPGGQLTAEITSVVKLMQTMKLDIPAYQRPYTWTAKNVSQLVSDIRRFSSAGHYRIGTFILHPSPSEEVGNAGETLDIDSAPWRGGIRIVIWSVALINEFRVWIITTTGVEGVLLGRDDGSELGHGGL